jgi:hypothetical protein
MPWTPIGLRNVGALTGGGEVVSLTYWLAAVYNQEGSWYSWLGRPQDDGLARRIRSIEKSRELNRN